MRYIKDVDPPPELSPDLEWMLQSGQVSLSYLMHNLASAYYEPFYHLALGLLNTREAALLAVQRIFLHIASHLHTYRSEKGAEAWLYSLAWSQLRSQAQNEQRWRMLENWLHLSGQFTALPVWTDSPAQERKLWEQLQTLPALERYALILTNQPGWGDEQAAALLQIPSASVQAAVSRGLERMRTHEDDGESLEAVQRCVSQAIGRLREANPPAELDVSFLLGKVDSHSRRTHLFRQGYATLKEVAVLVIGLALIGLLVWGGSRFFLDSEPAQIPEQQERLPTPLGERIGRPAGIALTPTPARTRQPAPTSIPSPTPSPTPAGVFYQTSLGEPLEHVAEFFGVSEVELRNLNRIAPEDGLARWQRLIVPGSIRQQPPQATPVTPVPLRDPPYAPPVTSDEVRKMLQMFSLPANTVWMDVLLVTEDETAGAPALKLSRMQGWLSQDQYLLITGPADGWPAEVMVNNGSRVYVARPGEGKRWFEQISPRAYEEPIDITFLFGLSLLFSETERLRGARYELLGEGAVAGRTTWVVSQTSELGGRRSILWIDQQTGLLLRHTRLNDETLAEAFDVLLPRDAIVMELAVDVDFPQELFDTGIPWRGTYARDHTGLVEPEGLIFPSWDSKEEAADLQEQGAPAASATQMPETGSRLSFRFPSPASTLLNQPASTNLYLGGVQIASIDLGRPWDLWCQRSVDGDLVVFSQAMTNPQLVSQPAQGPHYLRLSQPTQLLRPVDDPSEISSSFAISPDGEKIAFWACPSAGRDCGLYVHDTRTAENQKIIALSQGASNFVWSPDGEEVGVLGANESFFIVRLSDGELTYKGPYDSYMRAIPPDSPTYAWGIKYPPLQTGLDGCVLPPAGYAK